VLSSVLNQIDKNSRCSAENCELENQSNLISMDSNLGLKFLDGRKHTCQSFAKCSFRTCDSIEVHSGWNHLFPRTR